MKHTEITKITDVIRWCLNHGDSFPMPDDAIAWENYGVIQNDTPYGPDGYDFKAGDWFNVSKKFFAEYCDVKPSQVSRWIKAGLPVREDGRLDWGRAEAWLTNYERDVERRRANGWQG